MDIIQYPYDPSGTAATNKVTTVKTLPRVRNRAFAPDGGPFYKESVVLIDVETGQEIPKTSYDCLYLYSEATETVGQAVCGIINVHDEGYYGAVEAITQVVGGPFSSNVSVIQRMLETLEIDNRKIRFDDLIDVPVTMPPAPHLTFVGDLYGAEALVSSIEEITESNRNANLAMSDLIIQRYNDIYDLIAGLRNDSDNAGGDLEELRRVVNENHASVTSSISNLQNALANDKQDLQDKYQELVDAISVTNQQLSATITTVNDHSSRLTSQANSIHQLELRVNDLETAIEAMRNELLAHTRATNNPHNVTASQVGLGNVSNYPTGTIADLRSGTASRFVQASILKQYIDERMSAFTGEVGGDISSHTGNTNNPHNVTKSQVGLGLVANFAVATEAQAEAGTSSSTYMTPALTKASVLKFAAEGLNSHIQNLNNPHDVDKHDVGLGNVSNFTMGTIAEMRAGTGSRYAYSHIVKQFVEEKIAAINVTKNDVGLGSVANYGIASSSEARAGNTNSKYMTPYLVKLAIQQLAPDGGDSWTSNLQAGGDYGWIRHNPTGITLQWGQSHSLSHNTAAQCRFPKTFSARPWAVLGTSHTWTGDSSVSNNDDLNETIISVISRSVDYYSFDCVARRLDGGNTDGAVFSWIAIGHTNLSATDFPASRRSIAINARYSSNMGAPRSGTDIIAPIGSS